MKEYPKKPREVYLSDIVGYGKHADKSYKHIKLLEKNYWNWMLSENVIKVLGEKRPDNVHTEDDIDWKNTNPTILRFWTSGINIKPLINTITTF